jgi:hypothetical protein
MKEKTIQKRWKGEGKRVKTTEKMRRVKKDKQIEGKTRGEISGGKNS